MLDCLIAQYQEWVELLSQGHDIRLLSFDIAKAFDRVWHKGLLCKLKAYGIHGRLFDVLADFLRQRSLQVVLDGFISKEHPVLSGVPQGSILGPTLFLVFINDLGDNLVKKPHHFADDTTTKTSIAKDEDPSEPHKELQADLVKIEAWADAWLVSFNTSKTKELLISKARNMRAHPDFVFKGEVITRVDTLRLLGVNFSSDLSWTEHLSKIRSSCNKKLGVILRCKSLLPDDSILPLFNSCIRPVMEYACPLFAGAPKSHIAPLQHIQNRAVRAATSGNTKAKTPQLIQERFDVASMSVFYKYLYNPPSEELSKLVPDKAKPLRSTRRSTARQDYLEQGTPRQEYLKTSFARRSVATWNRLPAEVIPKNPSLDAFKRRYNKYLSVRK